MQINEGIVNKFLYDNHITYFDTAFHGSLILKASGCINNPFSYMYI